MREGEKGQDLNYKLILNPGHKTTAKFDMRKRLTQIKFKQRAYVMHEMKEKKGCLKRKNGSRRPRLPASFHAVASQQTSRGQDASTASTDATARPEEE